MDWLKEVIDNKDLKDDMVVTLAGGKTVQLGEIRSLSKAQQKALSDRDANLAAREAKLQKDLETLQLAQEETANLFKDLQSKKGKPNNDNDDNKGQADPLESLANDPILGPLARSIRHQNSQMEELRTKALAPLTKAIQDMASSYVSDRIELDYDRIVPDAKKSTVSLESILKVANDNGLKTRNGIPDIRRAYQHMTTRPMTQEDIDRQIAEAKEAGRKEAEEKARLRVPRPGIGSVGGVRDEGAFKPTKLNSVSDALSEAMAAAAKDADIWATVDNGTAN